MTKQEFIDMVKEGAIDAQKRYGICASLTIAQAILESGWGKNAPGNNLFGIKWIKNCGYRFQALSTKEYINGKWINVNAQFRIYDSFKQSVYDHAQFISKNIRYKDILGVKEYKKACELIQKAGYATDPNYANLLIMIIEENSLFKYDSIEVTRMKNIVVYGNDIDKRAAEYLADYLQCPTISKENIDFLIDSDSFENIYMVGGSWKPIDNAVLISGADRYETMKAVLKYINKI